MGGGQEKKTARRLEEGKGKKKEFGSL